jgi:hypothetical protein
MGWSSKSGDANQHQGSDGDTEFTVQLIHGDGVSNSITSRLMSSFYD